MTVNQLVRQLSGRPPQAGAELQRLLGLSQPTFSRLVRQAGERVARIGRGRSTRYAATRPVFGVSGAVGLYKVDPQGLVSELGSLRALSAGEYLFDAAVPAFWLLGEQAGLFRSLPYYLYDMRPQGFIGRLIARHWAQLTDAPPDPRGWNDDQIGHYLLRCASDAPGNLVLGQAAAQQANRDPGRPIVDRTMRYPELAERALDDALPGSSAAGEQPKFLAFVEDVGHVIVKYSPATESAEAQRTRDLLRAEGHASACLREQGVPAAATAVHEFSGRVFLESQRFDRHGRRGRLGAISLTMVDAEYVGVGSGWSNVCRALSARGLLDATSLAHVRWAETFGHWIGNTDMHLGNISLRPLDEQQFRLLPIYDMLPTAWSPVAGEIREAVVHPPIRTALNTDCWHPAGRAACVFWRRVADDPLISTGFRRVAEAQENCCAALLRA